jgi:hypothetical protein
MLEDPYLMRGHTNNSPNRDLPGGSAELGPAA